MKIAILGYGTVGKGLVEIIEGNKNKRNIQDRRYISQKYKKNMNLRNIMI